MDAIIIPVPPSIGVEVVLKNLELFVPLDDTFEITIIRPRPIKLVLLDTNTDQFIDIPNVTSNYPTPKYPIIIINSLTKGYDLAPLPYWTESLNVEIFMWKDR